MIKQTTKLYLKSYNVCSGKIELESKMVKLGFNFDGGY